MALPPEGYTEVKDLMAPAEEGCTEVKDLMAPAARGSISGGVCISGRYICWLSGYGHLWWERLVYVTAKGP